MTGDLHVTVRVEYETTSGRTRIELDAASDSGNPRHAAGVAERITHDLASDIRAALAGLYGEVTAR